MLLLLFVSALSNLYHSATEFLNLIGQNDSFSITAEYTVIQQFTWNCIVIYRKVLK